LSYAFVPHTFPDLIDLNNMSQLLGGACTRLCIPSLSLPPRNL